jgi:acyl-CoA synthetase (AMP-forming)/AMP-acid ligase II
LNLATLVTRAARFWGERTAVIEDDRTLSFAELDTRSTRLASALSSRGLRPGDRVAVQMGNRREWFDVTFGLLKGGFVAVALDPRHSAAERSYQLADSGARTLITAQETLLGVDLSMIEDVIELGPEYERILDHGDANWSTVDVPPEYLADVKYTSGTTGLAKGVLHTHGSRIAGIRGMLAHVAPTETDVLLLTGPLQRGSGALAWQFVAVGGLQVLRRGFDTADVLDALPRYGITTVLLVPTMIYKLLDVMDGKTDLGRLHTLHYAAAPMTRERIERALELMGPVLLQSYGSTEAYGGMTYLAKSDHIRGARQLSSCGRESIVGEVRIGDGDGLEVRTGEVGEILLRGPSMFKEYWNNAAATRESHTADGWFRTGDVGRVDDAGFIYLLDRMSDKIISGGINIYPNEIEQMLLAHSAVAEAAVFGVPDAHWGEAVRAVVRLQVGEVASEDDLRAWVRARLASHQVPKVVDFVETELPKGPTGKTLRRAISNPYWAGHGRRIG